METIMNGQGHGSEDLFNPDEYRRNEYSANMLRKIRERFSAEKLDIANRINVAKEANPDKEPFDLDRVAQRLPVGDRDDEGVIQVDPSVALDMEAKYYLDNAGIQTVDQFIDRQRELDAQDSN